MSIYSTNPGKYRHRVLVERAVISRDVVDGGVIINWFPFRSNVPAEVLTGPGKENVAADAQQGVEVARINMRWFPGLLSSMRITWDGKVYGITAPPETDSTGRREWRVQVSTAAHDGR
jgi:head-tail adaptor